MLLLVILLLGTTPTYNVEVQRSLNVPNEENMGVTETLLCLAGVNAMNRVLVNQSVT